MNLWGSNNCGHSHDIGMYYEVFLTLLSMDVHGSSWVGLRGFFDPTCTMMSQKKKIQPNPTHRISPMGWVGLGRVEPMG